MGIFYAIMEGIRDIASHKFRSALTILGVVLGASALLTMSSITEGMARGMRSQMLLTGDHIKIEVRRAAPPPEQTTLADTSPGLTLSDADALKEKINLVEWVSPELRKGVVATYENRRDRTNVIGVTEGILIQDLHEQPFGRFFSDLDMENRNRVCVLGGRIYERLFPDNYEEAVGSTIRINGIAFEVVGIFPFYLSLKQQRDLESGKLQEQQQRLEERRGRKRFLVNDAFPRKNNVIAIPITTFQEVFKNDSEDTQVIGDDMPIDKIFIGSKDPERMDDLIDQVRSLLLLTHKGIEDFEISHQLDRLDEVDQQVGAARLSGSVIAGIGLVVGGVGIANIMLASIADRIREIGIRLAVGARGVDIFLQVMMEALLLAVIGGLAGIALGYSLIYLLDNVAQIPNQPILTLEAVTFSFSFSLITGFIAGLYPAFKASALSPVEALRYN
ncbi:MAG: ABC transporter permease [Verrucomicrobiota bacterium]